MLKHILTGQPSNAGSRHHDYQTQGQQAHQQAPIATGPGAPHHHHHHTAQPDHHHHHHHPQHHQHFTAVSPVTRVTDRSNRHTSSDVYDTVIHPNNRNTINGHASHQPTPSSSHRHPLNHSQLSVNNLSQRFNNSHPLNISTLSTSKHSVDSASPTVVNSAIGNASSHHQAPSTGNPLNQERGETRVHANGGLDISRISRLACQTTTPSPALARNSRVNELARVHAHPSHLNSSWSSSLSKNNRASADKQQEGVKEMLTFLGLLCLVSLLLAMLSHIFLLKISPITVTPSSLISPEEYTIVYEVTLALCALALSLNLCCLLVCAIQFLFAVKLVKSSYQGHRTNKYLQKSSISRVCAVGGFFVSIPVFLTGMILYTFIQFHSTPAIVMSVFIGLGIVFCGCAMVHNVFVWQREKTNAVKALARAQCEAAAQLQRQHQLQHQQQTGRTTVATLNRAGGGVPKIGNLTAAHSTTTLQQHPRSASAAYQQHHQQTHQTHQPTHHQPQPQHHHHHPNHHRNVQTSPPLLISSPSGLAGTHGHSASGGVHHHHNGHRIPATPPTTPGDHSPPSPNGKHNRSQSHLQRDASGSVSPGLPPATLDLSSAATTNSPHELSTLV